jgi:lysozyme family protein
MASIRLSPDLRDEYVHLFNTCDVRPERALEVEALMQRVLSQQARYCQAESRCGVPWYFVAAVHQMESSGRFDRHLHNGDPLTARTRQVPAGRPLKGNPPFSWEVSAADALAMHRLSAATDWSLGSLLYELERYNGFGYRRYHPEVLSPYLWSYSDHYESGKYVADGRWSDTARSAQCGSATLLRRMVERGHVAFVDQPPPAPDASPLVVAYARRRPTAAATVEQGMRLQRWLNTFPGIFVKVDGWPGEKTSDAYRRVTGQLLPGDPRA